VGYLYTLPGRISVFVTETGTILMNLPAECMAAGSEFIAAAESWLSGAYNSTTTWITTTVTTAGTVLMNLPTTCAAAGAEFVASAENWGSQAYDSVVNWVSQIPGMVTNYISNAWQNLKGQFTIGFSAGRGGQVASNANGGIYDKGAFLTTFAEKSPEAAIPLDGSRRAVSLWQRAGEVLGMGTGGGAVLQFTYSPTISGNDAGTMQEADRQQKNFFEQAQDFAHQNARVSYGV